jgi:hypothetical protein
MTGSEKPPSIPESDARHLAELAQVPECSRDRFCESLEWQILEAHFGNEWRSKPLKASDLKRSIRRVASAARALNQALGAFWSEGRAGARAGSLLEVVLDAAAGERTASGVRVDAYRNGLALLIAATDEAGKRADAMLLPPPPTTKNKKRAGRPRGAGGNPAFDNFVKRLYEIVPQAGGRPWTHNPKSHGDGWSGTLMQALELLRPYLPESGFFPKAKLGFVLQRLAKRYGSDTAETQSMH